MFKSNSKTTIASRKIRLWIRTGGAVLALNMFNNIQFTCMLVVFYGICSSLGQTLPDETLYTDNACYGSSSGSYFHSNCSTNHAIAVSRVLGGAKPNTTGCPPVDDGNNPSNFSLCCVFSSGDCIEEFSGALKTYHDGCSGLEVCKLGTGATRDRFVNCQEPLVNNSFNSYMRLNYHCIDKTTIGSTCAPVSMTTSSKALYLWNSGYPSTTTADCNCSIEINSSTARIEVMALRIELFGNSSNCIRFLDGVCDTRETVLCSNQSAITVIYTSTSNYLLMEYRRGQINDSGRYWIRFKATSSSANLIVKCQPESKPVCTTTTSTTTTPSPTTSTTTTPSTTTSTTKTSSTTTTINTTTNSTTTTKTSTVTSTNSPKTNGTTLNTTGLVIPSTTAQEKSSTGVIIGVVVGVICLIILIVVIIIIYMRKIKPARDRKEADIEKTRDEQETEPADSNQESMTKQEAFSDGRNNAPPAATQFKLRDNVSADTFPEERSKFWQEKDGIETHQNMQNIALSSVLTNGDVLGDHQNDNGAGADEKKKPRKKKVKKKLVKIREQSLGEEENCMPFNEIYNENGEGRGRKKKGKKRKGKKRPERVDDVDDQDLEQKKEERHNFETKVHPEHQVEHNTKGMKEEKKKKKKKKKRKMHMKEEEGEEMMDGRMKIKQHREEEKGVQSGEEIKREGKKKKQYAEEEKEMHNGEYVERKKKRIRNEEEDRVQSDEEIREERKKTQEKYSEDVVQNDEEMKKKRKKKKKKQRHQKEETKDGYD